MIAIESDILENIGVQYVVGDFAFKYAKRAILLSICV